MIDRSTMTARSIPIQSGRLSAAAVLLLLALLLVALLGLFLSSVPLMAGSAVAGAFLLPRNALPAFGLWLLVLLPLAFTDVGWRLTLFGSFFTPAVIVTTIWLIRVYFAQRGTESGSVRVRGGVLIGSFLALLLVSMAVSASAVSQFGSVAISFDPRRVQAWMAVFLICMVAPAVLGQLSRDNIWPTVRLTFAGIGMFLGVLATLEFAAGFNPWSDILAGFARSATWSGAYRAKTSLGHPTASALVSSVALVVCLFSAGGQRRWPYWLGGVGALAALSFSASRSGVYAVAIAAMVGIVANRSKPTNHSKIKNTPARDRSRVTVLVVVAAALALALYSPFLARYANSAEGSDSASYRFSLLGRAADLIFQHPFLGFGPGTANWVYAQNYIGIGRVARLESSILQLFISLGIPASLLVLCGLLTVVAVAIKNSRAGVAAGIAAFLSVISGYNTLEANTAHLALAAPLIFCAVSPSEPARIPSVDPWRDRHSGLRAPRSKSTENII